MAEHLYTYDNPPSQKDIAKAVRILRNGGVLSYPTDLNWAFGCDATNSHGLDRLYRLKPTHGKELPFSLIASSISMAAEYVYISNGAYRVLRKAWPGPYTILMPAVRTLPRQLKDKRKIFGIRIPDSSLLIAIVNELGNPLASTSAPKIDANAQRKNKDSYDSDECGFVPKFGYEIYDEFGHALDLVLDLGQELTGLESTVVDMTTVIPEVLRVGAGDPSLFTNFETET